MSLLTKSIIAVVLLSIVATYPLEMKIKSVEAASAIIEGKITGDLDYVLDIFKTLRENPLVDLSEVILVLTDKHETPFSC